MTVITTVQGYIDQARNPGSASSNEDGGVTGKGNTTPVWRSFSIPLSIQSNAVQANDHQLEKGKWHGIQIISDNTIQAVTQSTLTAFNERWDKFMQEVSIENYFIILECRMLSVDSGSN